MGTVRAFHWLDSGRSQNSEASHVCNHVHTAVSNNPADFSLHEEYNYLSPYIILHVYYLLGQWSQPLVPEKLNSGA